MEMSESITEIAAALALAQAEIESAEKDRVNPHFKSSYATLASVWDACRIPLTKNGISIVQDATAEGSLVTVTTMMLHKSGQWFRGKISMLAANATPQAIGSATTYGRRYSLAAMAGVAPDDDDGNAGTGRQEAPREEARAGGEYRAQQPPPPASGSEPTTGSGSIRDHVKDVQSKSGTKKDGGAYTRYGIETAANGFFTTFSAALADVAMSAKESGAMVDIGYRANGRYRDVESLRLASEQNPKPTGRPAVDPDSLPF